MELSAHKLFAPVEPDQVGVVPYRVREGAIEVLLITSRRSRRWLIPKGNVEAELGPRESARREAFEEAGITGPIGGESLGCYRHGRSKKSPVVEVFLMRVESEEAAWPEAEERRRRWSPVEEALQRVSTLGLKALLGEAATLLRLSLSAGGRRQTLAHGALPAGTPPERPDPWG